MTPQHPGTVFDLLADAFERAREAYPNQTHESIHTFAGRPVRLRIVGRSLAEQIEPPLAHLRVPDPGPDPAHLTVDLWDQEETDIGCAPCVPQEDLAAPLAVEASPDGRYATYRLAESLTAFDRLHSRMIGWFARTNRLSLYERGRPLHAPLLLWHRDRGVQAVHAGLVAQNGHGVLFGGAGGSGKSTSALTCLLHGFSYLSDDYVGLEAANGTFVGHSLYGSTHLEPDHLQRFPALRPYAVPGRLAHEDKSLVLLGDVFPGRLARAAPIRLVLLPRVIREPETRARAATKGEALLRLAPSSLMMLPHAAGGGLRDLAGLVESVPCYWLELGRELDEIPARVTELLGKICG